MAALTQIESPANVVLSCLDVRSQHVERCLMRLAEEVRDPGFASGILVKSLAVTLIIELFRHLRGPRQGDAEALASLRRGN